ncbi:MAG: hypothetical protein WC365_09750 [Candidatus Babeliales bacterium]|jgi:hypothetical protein
MWYEIRILTQDIKESNENFEKRVNELLSIGYGVITVIPIQSINEYGVGITVPQYHLYKHEGKLGELKIKRGKA